MAIPPSFIQELLARADVVDVVGRYVQLKKAGANFAGLCPFHAEKSPSFTVSPVKQFYHCFGCGKNGDAIRFLMEHAGMSFVDAVKDLAGQYGLSVPEDERSPHQREYDAAQHQRRATLTEVLEKAAEAYRKHLKTSARAVAYLKGRGLSGEIARRFGLGYAPEGWRTLAGVFPDYDDDLLVQSGLVIAKTGGADDDSRAPASASAEAAHARRYDRFRDRIMFPIRNVKGQCIGFGGRVLGDEKPKYLNSPETPLFHKGHELYGLFEARSALREAGYALVTEGYMDVVALAQLGFANAVATLGTACTPEHVDKLFRLTDQIVFSFDGDAAGRRAARKALDAALALASDVRSVKFLFLPPEHDPDSYIRAHGSAAFAQCVADALPLSKFLLEAASDGCDLASAEGRARMAAQARPLWQTLPEGALKRQLLGDVAELARMDARDLLDVWQAQAASPRHAATGRVGLRAQDQQATESVGGYKNSSAPRSQYGVNPLKSISKTGRRASAWHPNAQALSSRSDHAARLLLAHMPLWDEIGQPDQALLCALPAPHGPLFCWIDAVFHDQGALAWGALQGELAGHSCEPLATQLMARDLTGTPLQDARHELRDLLNRLQVEHIKAEETALLSQAASGAQVQAQFLALQQRRKALAASASAPLDDPALP